jgi:hypothetical protein
VLIVQLAEAPGGRPVTVPAGVGQILSRWHFSLPAAEEKDLSAVPGNILFVRLRWGELAQADAAVAYRAVLALAAAPSP